MFSNLAANWYTQTTWQNTRFLKISAIFVEKWASCDFFGIYEVSGLKIPRNTAKFRNYESPYFSLKIVKSYQILVKVSQIWLIFISFENTICWTPTFLANFLLEKEKRWKKRKSSLNIIKLSSGQMRNGPTFLEHLFDIKCQISCCN